MSAESNYLESNSYVDHRIAAPHLRYRGAYCIGKNLEPRAWAEPRTTRTLFLEFIEIWGTAKTTANRITVVGVLATPLAVHIAWVAYATRAHLRAPAMGSSGAV